MSFHWKCAQSIQNKEKRLRCALFYIYPIIISLCTWQKVDHIKIACWWGGLKSLHNLIRGVNFFQLAPWRTLERIASRPCLNILVAGRPCFLIRIFSPSAILHSPARNDQQAASVRMHISASNRPRSVICVHSTSKPLDFKFSKSVSISQRSQ